MRFSADTGRISNTSHERKSYILIKQYEYIIYVIHYFVHCTCTHISCDDFRVIAGFYYDCEEICRAIDHAVRGAICDYNHTASTSEYRGDAFVEKDAASPECFIESKAQKTLKCYLKAWNE